MPSWIGWLLVLAGAIVGAYLWLRIVREVLHRRLAASKYAARQYSRCAKRIKDAQNPAEEMEHLD